MSLTSPNIINMPVVNSDQRPGPFVTFETWTVPSFCTNEDDGPGSMVMLMAYLTQVWLKTCAPIQPRFDEPRFGVMGTGYISVEDEPDGGQCSGAHIDIMELPPNMDVLFGSEDVLYAGVCGFGGIETTGISVPVREGIFNLGLSISPPRFGRLQWINHQNNEFYPEQTNQNIFWWHLKPGVVANITVFGQQTGQGIGGGNALPNEMRFNPLAGGWRPRDDASLPSPKIGPSNDPL